MIGWLDIWPVLVNVNSRQRDALASQPRKVPAPGHLNLSPQYHHKTRGQWQTSSISKHGNKLLRKPALQKLPQANKSPIACSHGLRNSTAYSDPTFVAMTDKKITVAQRRSPKSPHKIIRFRSFPAHYNPPIFRTCSSTALQEPAKPPRSSH